MYFYTSQSVLTGQSASPLMKINVTHFLLA